MIDLEMGAGGAADLMSAWGQIQLRHRLAWHFDEKFGHGVAISAEGSFFLAQQVNITMKSAVMHQWQWGKVGRDSVEP